MSSIRSLLLWTSVFTLANLLGGCGSTSLPLNSNNGGHSGSGPVPTVIAQALELNGVAPNRKQEVQFSEAMDPATINAKTFVITDPGGNQMPGVVSYDPGFNVAAFQPTPALETGASYTATINTGAASTGGMHLAAPYVFAFTTRAETDSSPLAVKQVSPAANAACVSPNAQIVITFNEAPDASTVTAQNIVVTDSNGNKITTTLSTNINTTQVMVTPASPLPSGVITVMVSNIGDLADLKMPQPFTWSFSTVCSASGGGSGAPGGFVYVSTPSVAGSAGNFIQGWSVAADGTLTAVPGSPFNTSGQAGQVVADGKYLFADMFAGGSMSIDTYSIAANGGLTLTTTIPAHSISGTPTIYNMGTTTDFTDRTGQTLYDFAQTYSVQSNGSLNWVGSITDGSGGYIEDQISFTGDDRFGYSSDCTSGNQNFWAFTHGSNGALTRFNPNANVPAVSPNPAGTSYCPTYSAAIPAPDNLHVIFSLQVGTGPMSYQGVNQLAVYTINYADGTLHTADTAATMPKTTVGQATDYKFDPSGNWLAVAGSSGLELFSYNNGMLSGGTTLLANDAPSQIGWDKAGHLFAVSQFSGKLYVFDVANGIATAAPGSPHAVPTYSYLAVQPAP
ncbi:MAG TPA: Ig-like domain-containing protein [Acidobacteriaceae bacterium]|nr:Ig-like domain-containing protein [Acidobacteriaceae bacterium]